MPNDTASRPRSHSGDRGSRPEGGRPRRWGPPRRKVCRFCSDKVEGLDYKDLERIGRYVTERGKILPSRLTGNCARHQRVLAAAIKRARFMAFLPYVSI